MDSTAREMIDEQFEEGFKIDTDSKAEWAIVKISEEQAESQRLINVCETRVLEYQEKIRKYKEQLEHKTSGLKGLLMQYFSTVQHKAAKTQETYKLPSGTLKLKYSTPTFVRDETKFTEWLKANGYTDKVKVKETADWAEFKKTVTVDADKVLTADGEIVEGVTVTWNPENFEVEI